MKIIYLKKDSIYINEDDRVVRKDFSYEKGGVVTATVSYKSIINMTFKLSKSIEKDMLEVEAEKYIFNEGSLSYDKEYKINFLFTEHEEHYNVEAFVIETEILKKEFSSFLETYKYIDFISAKPFVFGAYYDITNIVPANDIFIYLDEDEAFMSCFTNGELRFVKSLNKISILSQQLNMDIKDVVKILEEKGIDENSYEDHVQFSTVDSYISEFFSKVTNLINYAASYYTVPKIDRIYFYSPFNIKGMYEKYESFWHLSGIEFKKYSLDTDYDSFDYTAVMFNSKNYMNENINFSIFPKPEPFYKTKSGIMLIITGICLLGIALDAGYKYYILTQQKDVMSILKVKIAKKERETKLLKTTIKKYRKKIDNLQQQNSDLQKQISDIGDKIIFLSQIQKKPLLSNQFADIVKELKKYNLKIISFDKKANHIQIYIISNFNNSSDIAKFMKDLYRLGYKNVTSTQIKNNNGSYISEVSYDE